MPWVNEGELGKINLELGEGGEKGKAKNGKQKKRQKCEVKNKNWQNKMQK